MPRYRDPEPPQRFELQSRLKKHVCVKLTDLADVHELDCHLLAVLAVDTEVYFAESALTKELVDDIVVENHAVIELLP